VRGAGTEDRGPARAWGVGGDRAIHDRGAIPVAVGGVGSLVRHRAIADEAGIRDLPRVREATARLADPRRTTPEEAEAIIAGARPVYYFNCALHADENGSAEM